MKSFDSGITAELAKEVAAIFYLVELQFSATYRFTDCDIPLYYGGNKYTPFPFKIGSIATSMEMSVDTLEILFSNVGLGMSSILLGEDVTYDVILVSFCCVGSDYQIIEAESLFKGFVSSWEISEMQARIDLSNEFIFWSKRPLRICQASCRWDFKGTECGYSSTQTSCDKTYFRCLQLNNSDNFGGFRFLPDIAEKKLWWGREPKI